MSTQGLEKYGPILKTKQAEELVIEVFRTSRKEKAQGRKGLPVCAWGPAGIGKTELPNYLVKAYAEELFDGNVVYIPMAQIEEKAELQGLPELLEQVEPYDGKSVVPTSATIRKDVIDGIVKEFLVTASTVYATPSWIPQEETHGKRGLLVIDDMNRADGRIINSIMQLLQDGKLLGWELPQEWEIYCTCNPDDGTYQVTPFDGAQMTRMVNFRQEFDPKSWLENWAIPTGIHPVAQNFVMTLPESVVQGERTNPRSFDKLFRLAAPYLDELKGLNKDNIGSSDVVSKIKMLGLANIEQESLTSFLQFITDGFGKLPNIDEILDMNFDLDQFYDTIYTQGVLRIDIVKTLDCRIFLFAKSLEQKEMKKYYKGIQRWLKHKKLPSDLRYYSATQAIDLDQEIADEQLAEVIFSRYHG
jgi:hypothetical protein